MERIRTALKILDDNYDLKRNAYEFDSAVLLNKIHCLIGDYVSDCGNEPLMRIDVYKDMVRVYDNGKEIHDVKGIRFNANVDCPPVVTITKFIGRGEK